MLRIHFTTADLANTRIAQAPDAMWELSLSMHVLRARGSDPLLASWKHEMLWRLRPGTELRGRVAGPLVLNPPVGYFPDFLTPAEASGGFDAGLEAVLATPKDRLRREIAMLGDSQRALKPTIADVGAGDVAALYDLGKGMRHYYDAALAPVWQRVRAAFDADRAVKARSLIDGGPEGMLNNLHPTTTYADGVLKIHNRSAGQDLYLDGRGLLLVPSYFKANEKPMMLADPRLPPVLVYAMDRRARLVSDAGRERLAALIGRTRAAVLELAADGGTTSDVAHRLEISLPAASQHLGVLRGSGLVVSSRDRNSVHHTLTPLGRALLDGR